jgi:hypothetical protein
MEPNSGPGDHMNRKVVCFGGSAALALIGAVGALRVPPAFDVRANVPAKKSCDRGCLDGFVGSNQQ